MITADSTPRRGRFAAATLLRPAGIETGSVLVIGLDDAVDLIDACSSVEGREMRPVQKLLRNTVGVPARGVKRLARTATQPLKGHRQARQTRRRSRSSS